MNAFSRRLRLLPMLACLAAVGSAHAVDFRSVGTSPAIMYDAPSEKGRKVFVAPRGMPVEVVLAYGEWIKVRDAGGDLAWVESRTLVPKRMLVVTAASGKVRAVADESAPLVLSAERGVLLELAEPVASGWVKVRHRDGIGGFIKATDVWGD
ncbi:MAG: SH3 domain-containing protein [Herminiimonas sp.]|nr:SH3 domain-containing protein [Herminiimonas sp.]